MIIASSSWGSVAKVTCSGTAALARRIGGGQAYGRPAVAGVVVTEGTTTQETSVPRGIGRIVLLPGHRVLGDQEMTAYIHARKSQPAGDMGDATGAVEATLELARRREQAESRRDAPRRIPP